MSDRSQDVAGDSPAQQQRRPTQRKSPRKPHDAFPDLDASLSLHRILAAKASQCEIAFFGKGDKTAGSLIVHTFGDPDGENSGPSDQRYEMKRLVPKTICSALLAFFGTADAAEKPRAYRPPRLPDGHVDMQGI